MNEPQFSLAQNLSQADENRITYFAITDTRNKRVPFGIKKEDRSRHTYVIGKTGMGKSTLLENMAVQDIQNGEGLCFIDPHGGTAEKLMEYIPEERVKDVLYFAPFDMQYPVSFNVLENVDADKRHLVVAGLMSTFEKIWVDAWSARMAYILQNTLASLLEFPGATLLGVNRMYIDKEYRKNVIAKISDPAVRSFWVDEYSKYTDRYAQEATPAIQNKIGQFASNALVRNVIGQSESAFNIRDLMDQKKIFIVNLSKGRVGEGNANLLGSMLITKIYLAAMSRADVAAASMRATPPFYLYVDEFQNFANKSFADILSEARKYKLSLTIAHQYIEQMEEEVRAAVFGNVGSMITFRVGAYDAEVLEKEFAPVFTADDLVNLGSRQIYLKLMIDGVSSQPFSAVTMPPIQEPEVSHRDRAVAFSRAQFSRPREEVEKNISDWVSMKYEDPEAETKEAARMERRAIREQEAAPPSRGASYPPRQGDPSPRTPRPSPQDSYRPPRAPHTYPTVERSGERMAPPEQVRTYVAPQVPRDQVRPTPLRASDGRSGPPRRPFTPPRPLPPQKKQESIADLRSVLGRMASQPPKPETPAPPSPQVAEGASGLVSTTPPAPSAPRVRDDGKGVTEDGRQELRNLLAGLAKPAASAGERAAVPPQTPPIPPVTPPQPVTEQRTAPLRRADVPPMQRVPKHPTHVPVVDVSEAPPVRAQHEQSVHAEHAAPPIDIPTVDLRTMLHVDKPDVP